MIKKILIIKYGALGDILHMTPCLESIRDKFPKSSITFLVGRGYEAMIKNNPYVDEILLFDKRGEHEGFIRHLLFALELKKMQFDIVVNLHPSLRSSLFLLLSGAKTKVTYKKDKHPLLGKKARHAVENFFATLEPLGISKNGLSLTPQFWIQKKDQKRVNELLKRALENYEKPIVGVNVGASRAINRWPIDHIAKLCDRLIDDLGITIAITGGPEDIGLAYEAEEMMTNKAVNFSGKLSLGELAAFLERCDIYVTADTGPMHLAAAVGTNVIALAGPADPDRTGPIGDSHTVLQNSGLDCVPCRRKSCYRNHECMKGLSVDKVFEAINQKLANRGIKTGKGTTQSSLP